MVQAPMPCAKGDDESSKSTSSSESEAEHEICAAEAGQLDVCSAASESSSASVASPSSATQLESDEEGPEAPPACDKGIGAVVEAPPSLDPMEVEAPETDPSSMKMDALQEVLQQFEDSDMENSKPVRVESSSESSESSSGSEKGDNEGSDHPPLALHRQGAKQHLRTENSFEHEADENMSIDGQSLSDSEDSRPLLHLVANEDENKAAPPVSDKKLLRQSRALRSPSKPPSHPARSSWQADEANEASASISAWNFELDLL